MRTTGPWQRAAAGAGLLSPSGDPGTTIFAEMSALAQATGAINLGQGFPDTDGPAEVLEAAREAIAAGVNQYPPGRGEPVLRQAIAAHLLRFQGLVRDSDTEVLVTAGATEALAATLLAFVEPGDEVVTVEPFYDAYGAVIGLAGGVHRAVPLRAPDFALDVDALAAAVTDRTRVILLNSPHNPTGTLLTAEAAAVVVELAERHDCLIVADEVYEHLVFAPARHTSLAAMPGAAARTVAISSGGKTFSTTGWKVGWLSAPADVVTRITAVKQFLTYVNGAPFQPAIALGLGLPDEVFTGIAADLRSRRDLLLDGLAAAGLPARVPQAGYFAIADAAALGWDDATAFCRALPELAGVVAIPLPAFVRPGHETQYRSMVRFAYCKRPEVLAEASARLATLRAR